MAAEIQKHWLPPEEYMIQEREATFRSEYWDGILVGMAGGSPAHNRIVRNLTRRLCNQLAGTPHESFASETRVRVSACNAYFYPDISIVCGQARYDADEAENLLNPTVVVEVLSSGTEAADRGRKFACYRSLPSLQYYVLLEQQAPSLDLYIRQEDGHWLLAPLSGLDAFLTIHAAGVSLPFTEIYERVDFPDAGAAL